MVENERKNPPKYVEMSAAAEINISEILSQFLTSRFLVWLEQQKARREMNDDDNK